MSKDTSVADGEPIEVYKFIGSGGIFRYTNNSEPITVDKEEYLPSEITRGAIEVGSVIDSPMTNDFVIPANDKLALAYAFEYSPQELRVEVRRVHRGDNYATDFTVEWQGIAKSYNTSEDRTTISTVSVIQDQLSGNTVAIYYQRMCNHRLYDARCKVNRADYTTASQVTVIQNQIITVENTFVANGQLRGGEIKLVRTGETRGIIDNNDNVLRIGYPFASVELGDTVEMSKGCNHLRLGDCKNLFNNVNNYGGFDDIPLVNPFEELLRNNLAEVTSYVKEKKEREYWNVNTESGKVS